MSGSYHTYEEGMSHMNELCRMYLAIAHIYKWPAGYYVYIYTFSHVGHVTRTYKKSCDIGITHIYKKSCDIGITHIYEKSCDIGISHVAHA